MSVTVVLARIAKPEPGVVVEEDTVAVVTGVPFSGEEDSHVFAAVAGGNRASVAVEEDIPADVVGEERLGEEASVPEEVQTEYPPPEVLPGLPYFPHFRLPI